MVSDQETVCAVCLERKHTPLRRDEMGGYVCLTCVDRQLDALQAAAAIPPSGEAKLRRCEVTGNPTGTDTWAVGYECKCSACQSMLVEGSVAQPSVFISRAFDPLTTHRFAAPPAPIAIDEAMVEGLRGIKDAADSFRDESGDEVAGQVILRVDALLAALNPQPNGGRDGQA